MIEQGMAPSEVFLALWRQWARTDKSTAEDFAVCAAAWAEIRRMEDHAKKSRAEFDDARRRIMDGFSPGPIQIVAADRTPIPSFWTEKNEGKTDFHAPAGLGMTETKEPEDAGGASPSPTEETKPERVYSAYVDYTGEMHGPTDGPLPAEAEAEADGVQSGPEEPDPEAGMSSWMRRRLRIQRRVLATRFSTQQIADASEKQLTVAEIRAFCDSYAALQGGKLKYLEEAMDKLEGKP